MIALIGSEGSMGLRYQAVLNHLKVPFTPFDKKNDKDDAKIIKAAGQCDAIIIATPTETHLDYLKALLPLKKPILCEKPVCTDLAKLIALHADCAAKGYSYNMVMQYRRLDLPLKTPNRWSFYNYFRPGKPEDSLEWNCMQTIALANGPVWIKQESPIWECTINGRSLSIADMDKAYVDEIRLWLMGAADQSMDEILLAHKKVVEFKEKQA